MNGQQYVKLGSALRSQNLVSVSFFCMSVGRRSRPGRRRQQKAVSQCNRL